MRGDVELNLGWQLADKLALVVLEHVRVAVLAVFGVIRVNGMKVFVVCRQHDNRCRQSVVARA